LERKVEDIGALQKRYANDWEQTFFNRLCRGFGFNINSEPFEHFANILDVRLLMKYSYNLKQTEALLFGVSGLLSATLEIDYYNELQKEFNHLKAAHKLSTMNPAAWKFSKTRPGNFPTLRLAQIAALYHKHQKLFSKILVVNEVEDMHKILKMDVSEFWKSHYTFNKKSPRENISLGNSSVDLLIINTIIPMMFAYSVSTGNEERKEKAVEMLYKLSPENNQITRIYEDLGLKNENSAHSQALLQLYKNYCKQKKCLFCSIGKDLLK
jgi:hypothetical protein